MRFSYVFLNPKIADRDVGLIRTKQVFLSTALFMDFK